MLIHSLPKYQINGSLLHLTHKEYCKLLKSQKTAQRTRNTSLIMIDRQDMWETRHWFRKEVFDIIQE